MLNGPNELKNTGHGHVVPRSDGLKARCGGPGLCTECSHEQAAEESRRRLAEKPTAAPAPDSSDEEAKKQKRYVQVELSRCRADRMALKAENTKLELDVLVMDARMKKERARSEKLVEALEGIVRGCDKGAVVISDQSKNYWNRETMQHIARAALAEWRGNE